MMSTPVSLAKETCSHAQVVGPQRRVPSRSLGNRAPLLWLLLPYAGGLIAAKVFDLEIPRWLAAGAVASTLAASVAAWRGWNLRVWPLALIAAMLCAGGLEYIVKRPPMGVWASAPPREARLTLRVDRLFPRADPLRCAGLATVERAEEPLAELHGRRIYFAFALRRGVTAPLRSTVIEAIGVLTPVPRGAAVDTFDGYLENAGIDFKLGRGRLAGIAAPASIYQRALGHIAARLEVLLSAGIPPRAADLGAIYRAMMLGKKYELSEEQDTLFMQSGTMHLFAINGLHIGVVALALQALFSGLRLPRAVSAVLTLAILWIDVDATGASPSAVRAYLLVASYEVALVLRLRASGLAALAAAGLVIVLTDPFAIFSASFQMSYTAVLAILTFGLPLAERLEGVWHPFLWVPKADLTRAQRAAGAAWRWFAGTAGIGCAAGLAGALTATTFYHTLTPGSLLTNLLLIPLASVVIVAGFVSVAVGLTGPLWASAFFNRAALVVLYTIDHLIRLTVRAPAMWWQVHWRAEWVAPVALGLFLGSLFFGYIQGWRRARGGFWPPVVIVAVALGAGVRYG